MEKEFKKSFMHPTRRKLAEMVQTGTYDANTQVSLSDLGSEENKQRKVGETWTDSDGSMWEQKEYGKLQKSAITDTMAEVRQFLQSISQCKDVNCKTVKYSAVDKKLISKTGFCLHCLTERELRVKLDGLWEEYENYKIYSNMISEGIELISKFKQAYADAKQEYEYINENGTTEMWRMERPVDELKQEIMDTITQIQKELDEVVEKRFEVWEVLKEKNYDFLNPLT